MDGPRSVCVVTPVRHVRPDAQPSGTFQGRIWNGLRDLHGGCRQGEGARPGRDRLTVHHRGALPRRAERSARRPPSRPPPTAGSRRSSATCRRCASATTSSTTSSSRRRAVPSTVPARSSARPARRTSDQKARAPAALLPAKGIMTFDTDDLKKMQTDGTLNDVITHEMGHVLGIGTIWPLKKLLKGEGTDNPTFSGKAAMAAYKELRGASRAVRVPVENTGGPGTAGGHWRETVFRNELMSGFIAAPGNPMSSVTVEQPSGSRLHGRPERRRALHAARPPVPRRGGPARHAARSVRRRCRAHQPPCRPPPGEPRLGVTRERGVHPTRGQGSPEGEPGPAGEPHPSAAEPVHPRDGGAEHRSRMRELGASESEDGSLAAGTKVVLLRSDDHERASVVDSKGLYVVVPLSMLRPLSEPSP